MVAFLASLSTNKFKLSIQEQRESAAFALMMMCMLICFLDEFIRDFSGDFASGLVTAGIKEVTFSIGKYNLIGYELQYEVEVCYYHDNCFYSLIMLFFQKSTLLFDFVLKTRSL